jgi:hypothetical protein
VDHIAESTGAHNVVVDNTLNPAAAVGIKVDHIAESTGAHGVELDQVGNTTRGIIATLGGSS